jgi:hypothetical protein
VATAAANKSVLIITLNFFALMAKDENQWAKITEPLEGPVLGLGP